MNQDTLLNEIKSIAKIEQKILQNAAIPEFDALAMGTLSQKEIERLHLLALEDESVALALEAFTPLNDDFKDSITDSIMASLAEDQVQLRKTSLTSSFMQQVYTWRNQLKKLFSFKMVYIAPALSVGVFIAILLPKILITEVQIPHFTIEMNGDKKLRSIQKKPLKLSRYFNGSHINVLLRPDIAVSSPLTVHTYLYTHKKLQPIKLQTKISPQGSIKLSGTVGTHFNVKPGNYDFITIISAKNTSFSEKELLKHLNDNSLKDKSWEIISEPIEFLSGDKSVP